jgi:hypothetical protein
MTNEDILKNLKNLCDGAIKMGLISKTEDAAMLHEMFLLIQTRLSEPATSNYKQFQSSVNHATPDKGPAEIGIRQPERY